MCHFYAFLTVLIWSFSYVGTKMISGSFSPGVLGALRCLAAAVVLMSVALLFRLRPPQRRDLLLFLASGASGMALYLVFFNSGIARIGATTSCILIALAPVFSALLAAVLFKERLSPLGWLAIGASFCGILIMSLWNGTVNINIGVLWTLVAAALFAVYNLLQRRLARNYEPRVITAYSFLLGAILLSPYLLQAAPQIAAAPFSHSLVALFLGVFPSALAYLLWGKALSVAPQTSSVTNYMFLTPFLSLILELSLLRQYPDMGAILGGLIILASLVLFSVAGKR